MLRANFHFPPFSVPSLFPLLLPFNFPCPLFFFLLTFSPLVFPVHFAFPFPFSFFSFHFLFSLSFPFSCSHSFPLPFFSFPFPFPLIIFPFHFFSFPASFFFSVPLLYLYSFSSSFPFPFHLHIFFFLSSFPSFFFFFPFPFPFIFPSSPFPHRSPLLSLSLLLPPSFLPFTPFSPLPLHPDTHLPEPAAAPGPLQPCPAPLGGSGGVSPGGSGRGAPTPARRRGRSAEPVQARALPSHFAGTGAPRGGGPVPPIPTRVLLPPRRDPRLALTSELVSSDPRWTSTPGSRAAGRAMHGGPGRGPAAGTLFLRGGGRRGEGGRGRGSGWRRRGAASTSEPRRPPPAAAGAVSAAGAGVCARCGPGAALSSGGSGPSRGERRLAAGAGSGCCSWDPAWKSEKDTPSTTAGSQMKTSGLL